MAQLDLFRVQPPPWNIGRLVGAKPPLKPKHIWAAPAARNTRSKSPAQPRRRKAAMAAEGA